MDYFGACPGASAEGILGANKLHNVLFRHPTGTLSREWDCEWGLLYFGVEIVSGNLPDGTYNPSVGRSGVYRGVGAVGIMSVHRCGTGLYPCQFDTPGRRQPLWMLCYPLHLCVGVPLPQRLPPATYLG